MIEAGYWSDKLRPCLVRKCQAQKLRHHFERVENMVGDGTPDVDYCIAGVAGKIELKYTDRHPVNELTPVLGRGKGMRRSQVIYAARLVWAGGLCWCIVGTPEANWVLDLRTMTPQQMENTGLMTVREFTAISCWNGKRLTSLPVSLFALK